MKTQCIMFVALVCLTMGVTGVRAEGTMMSMQEHRAEGNRIICEKKVACQEPIQLDVCVNTWNKVAEIEIAEQGVEKITALRSVMCRDYLRQKATCDNLTEIYKEGECVLSQLTNTQ